MFNGTGRVKARHFLILVEPIIVTFVVTTIWAFFRGFGFFVPEGDANISTNAYLPIVGMLYGFTAVVILSRVIEEDIRIHVCVDAGDREGLKKELKRRIHPFVHILLGLMTLQLLAGFVALPYQSFWSGFKDVGGITFILMLYWKTALVLDNPLRAPWIRDVIPPDWREELEQK